jgi:carboxyl-terminal processing protease
VDSPSDRRVVALIRDEIKLEDQEVKGKVIELPAGAKTPPRIGVIDLPSFYATIDLGGPKSVEPAAEDGGAGRPTPRSTSADVARLLKKFTDEKVAGVILDLRRNGGGSLEEAIKLTGLFIKEGPVVQVRGSDDGLLVREDTDPTVAYDGPLIVLTSRFSASASEIVAGALQDYGRALVVGDISTHGKGTVQNLNPLRFWVKPATATATNDPGQLKVTIQKFYRASGASTQLKGVMPDIVLPSVLNYSKDIGEDALENPLKWDTIPSAKFEKLNLVAPCLSELLKRSNHRVTSDQDFAYVREDIELFRKNQADKTISLNEKQRLKEKDELEARQKARDQERLARKEPDRKIYELALKQLALPGLPPPVEKTNAAAKSFAGKAASFGTSTNSASVAPKPPAPPGELDEDEAEETPPAVDAALEEAERILVDYIALLSQKSLVTVNR